MFSRSSAKISTRGSREQGADQEADQLAHAPTLKLLPLPDRRVCHGQVHVFMLMKSREPTARAAFLDVFVGSLRTVADVLTCPCR